MILEPEHVQEARERRFRRIAWISAALVALLVAVLAVASWLLSSLLVVPHHDLAQEDIAVAFVASGSVVLERTAASERPGVYGLAWDGGHAVVGPVTARTRNTVTRPLRDVRGRLVPGADVAIDADVFEGNPRTARHIPFRGVEVPGPLGPMPAWLVPGRGPTWVLFVHGINGSRAAGLRPLPTLAAAGLPTLLISYRNDVGAPPSPDGKIHLGMTEWQDLEAAARYAVEHGAARLILYGESMGGTIATRFLHESPLARRVTALVLDAPVLDWQSVIQHQADRFHVPFMAGLVESAIKVRTGVDWAALDELDRAASFRVPILLFQGLADPLVPPAESRAFAAAVPGRRATFVGVPRAGHLQSWNVAPSRYDATLAAFLRRVVPGSTR